MASDTPQITVVDASTGETITRNMNANELAQYRADQAVYEKDLAEKAQRQTEKERIAAALGITLDELKILLS